MPGFASLISISGIRPAKTMPFSKSHHQGIHELLEPRVSAISAQRYRGISQLLLDYIPFSPDYTTITQSSRRWRVIFYAAFSLFRGATTRNRVHFANHAHPETGLLFVSISLQFANDLSVVGCWTSSKSPSRGEKGPACSACAEMGSL